MKIYFLTNFPIFVGVRSLIFEKWQKIKNFKVRTPTDWKLSNEKWQKIKNFKVRTPTFRKMAKNEKFSS